MSIVRTICLPTNTADKIIGNKEEIWFARRPCKDRTWALGRHFFHEWIYRFGKTVTKIPLRQASLAGAFFLTCHEPNDGSLHRIKRRK